MAGAHGGLSAMKVVLGLGCDRGVATDTLHEAIHQALEHISLSVDHVERVASIDKKSDEIAILQLCQHYRWPFDTFPASELACVDVPNPSEVVRRYMGTPSVGEAAAILSARADKQALLLEKLRFRGKDGKHATVSVCAIGCD